MINRRNFLTLATLSVLFPLSVRAQSAEKAAAFVKSTGDRLVGVVNGPGSISDKRAAMTQIINSDVDVEGIARFCLGRYWKQATPEQQKQYLALFHEVLVTNITSKLGEYQGVTFTMGAQQAAGRGGGGFDDRGPPEQSPNRSGLDHCQSFGRGKDYRCGCRGDVAAADPAAGLWVLPATQQR